MNAISRAAHEPIGEAEFAEELGEARHQRDDSHVLAGDIGIGTPETGHRMAGSLGQIN
jgi:hypothetical protein